LGAAYTGADWHQLSHGRLDDLEAKFREVWPEDAVAVTGVHQEIFGRQAQLLGDAGAELRQEVGLNPSQFAEGDGIDGQDYDGSVTFLEHEGFGVECVADRNCPIGDIGHRRTGFEGVKAW
jgi:hypothetical protein